MWTHCGFWPPSLALKAHLKWVFEFDQYAIGESLQRGKPLSVFKWTPDCSFKTDLENWIYPLTPQEHKISTSTEIKGKYWAWRCVTSVSASSVSDPSVITTSNCVWDNKWAVTWYLQWCVTNYGHDLRLVMSACHYLRGKSKERNCLLLKICVLPAQTENHHCLLTQKDKTNNLFVFP